MLALVYVNILRNYSLYKTEIKLPESKSGKRNTAIKQRRITVYIYGKDINNKGEVRN
jgi:hypothetical protein